MAERSPELGPEMGCRDGDPTGKTRHLACEEFASVASCDASVARRYLAENDWEMQVRRLYRLCVFPRTARAQRPFPCLFFRER